MRACLTIILLLPTLLSPAQKSDPVEIDVGNRKATHINGVFPNLTILGPHVNRSESGIGALVPWADKLWMIGYVAHIEGSRIGLYMINDHMVMKKHPESVTGTFANRMIHGPSDQAIIGPHFIDIKGQVRTSEELSKHRLAATMEHLTDPENEVLFLTMEGLLFECDVSTLETTQLFNIIEELGMPEDTYVHFKGGFTGNGRVVVANNAYTENDYLGEEGSGVLAEWDGNAWRIIERAPFVEVNGKLSGNLLGKSVFGNPIFAAGWDNRSVILMNYNDRSGTWKKFRLPKASHSFDHAWNTEWMRIREAQTERFIMDIHGIFYELPMMTYGGEVWGIKPISHHLRIVPDFCFWRGMFVMAGDQTDHGVGQPQSGLLFQNIDDLWNYGKPTGWGAVWREDAVRAGESSDPFLMTGFDKKTVHITNHSNKTINLILDVDYLGNGSWNVYEEITVDPLEYRYHIIPDGFSAHWIRARVDKSAQITVQFVYN